MSVASEITRLQGIKSDIRTALVAKGITSASTHDMADFAEDIGDIQTGGGITPPTTGSFEGSSALVKTISVDKKPSAVSFKNTTNTHKVSADYFVGTPNNKQHYTYDDNDGVNTLGSTATYTAMIQTVTSSSVSVRLPSASTHANGTWEYTFYYND